MGTYQIKVFITQAAYEYGLNTWGDGYRIRDRAITYITHAIEDYSNHDVVPLQGTDRPDPLVERCQEQFTQSCICHSRYSCNYDDLISYFDQWLNNSCSDRTIADGVNLLVSSADRSNNPRGVLGYGGGKLATCDGGRYIGELPSNGLV